MASIITPANRIICNDGTSNLWKSNFFNAFTTYGIRACNFPLVKALAAYEIPICRLNCCFNCEHFQYKDDFCTFPEE